MTCGSTDSPRPSKTALSSSGSSEPSPLVSISSNFLRSSAWLSEAASGSPMASERSTSCHWMPYCSFELPLSAASLKSSWKVTAVKRVPITSKIVASLSTRSIP